MGSCMADKVKGILEATKTKERTQGAVTAILVVVAILTTVEFLGAIEFRTLPKQYWTSPDERKHALGFPSYDNPEYKLSITEIGEYAGSLVVTAEKTDGWSYNGTFYIDDTVLLGNYRVTIKEINMDRDKPILLEYYQLMDLKPLLVIALVLLVVGMYYSWK